MISTNKKLKVTDLNPFLICVLCKGYYIDATTIVECLHSFCKTCIVKYLKRHKYCPICDVLVYKTKPLQNIRSDQRLQNVVYKLIPGLYEREMQRRQLFFSSAPPESLLGISGEDRGVVTESSEIILPDENISITLEYLAHSGDDINKDIYGRRYLRCKASAPMSILHKFLRNKFNLSNKHCVDLVCNNEQLTSTMSVMDVAYVYQWKKQTPMHLGYRILETKIKRICEKDKEEVENSKRLKLSEEVSEDIVSVPDCTPITNIVPSEHESAAKPTIVPVNNLDRPLSVNQQPLQSNQQPLQSNQQPLQSNQQPLHSSEWKEVELKINDNGEMRATPVASQSNSILNLTSPATKPFSSVNSSVASDNHVLNISSAQLNNYLANTTTFASLMPRPSFMPSEIRTLSQGSKYGITVNAMTLGQTAGNNVGGSTSVSGTSSLGTYTVGISTSVSGTNTVGNMPHTVGSSTSGSVTNTVGSSTSGSGTNTVGGNTSVSVTNTVGSSTSVLVTNTVGGNTSVSGTNTVGRNTSVTGSTSTTVSNTVGPTSLATIHNNLGQNSSVAAGSHTVRGNTLITGNNSLGMISVGGSTSLSGSNMGAYISAGGNPLQAGNTLVTGNNVGANISATGNNTVGGIASLTGNNIVRGKTLAGNNIVGGSSSLAGNTTSGNVSNRAFVYPMIQENRATTHMTFSNPSMKLSPAPPPSTYTPRASRPRAPSQPRYKTLKTGVQPWNPTVSRTKVSVGSCDPSKPQETISKIFKSRNTARFMNSPSPPSTMAKSTVQDTSKPRPAHSTVTKVDPRTLSPIVPVSSSANSKSDSPTYISTPSSPSHLSGDKHKYARPTPNPFLHPSFFYPGFLPYASDSNPLLPNSHPDFMKAMSALYQQNPAFHSSLPPSISTLFNHHIPSQNEKKLPTSLGSSSPRSPVTSSRSSPHSSSSEPKSTSANHIYSLANLPSSISVSPTPTTSISHHLPPSIKSYIPLNSISNSKASSVNKTFSPVKSSPGGKDKSPTSVNSIFSPANMIASSKSYPSSSISPLAAVSSSVSSQPLSLVTTSSTANDKKKELSKESAEPKVTHVVSSLQMNSTTNSISNTIPGSKAETISTSTTATNAQNMKNSVAEIKSVDIFVDKKENTCDSKKEVCETPKNNILTNGENNNNLKPPSSISNS